MSALKTVCFGSISLAFVLPATAQASSMSPVSPQLSIGCRSALKQSVSTLTQYLEPGYRLQDISLQLNNQDLLHRQPVGLSLFDASVDYKAVPNTNSALLNITYYSRASKDRWNAVIKSEGYRNKIASKILENCDSVGMVRFQPFRMTGATYTHGLINGGSRVGVLKTVQPSCDGRYQPKLNWGIVWGEC